MYLEGVNENEVQRVKQNLFSKKPQPLCPESRECIKILLQIHSTPAPSISHENLGNFKNLEYTTGLQKIHCNF